MKRNRWRKRRRKDEKRRTEGERIYYKKCVGLKLCAVHDWLKPHSRTR
jgi:hypothetical protein